ncbi:MAG: DUF3275 family protein [Proteobacteria bacterium]|nr:DUF3275 family protein [Pseudomonadota bacterium]
MDWLLLKISKEGLTLRLRWGEYDKTLFGSLWPLGDVVKLDTNVERLLFLEQQERLQALGYQFNDKSLDWHRKTQ